MPRRINIEQIRANKRRYNDEIAASPDYKILDALVKQTSNIEDTVQRIIDKTKDAAISQPELTEEEKKRYPVPSNVGNLCYAFAGCVLVCAQRTPPEQQDPLVALIVRLQDVKLTDPKTKQPFMVDGQVVWKDLPTFGYSFADELGSVNPQHVDVTPEDRKRWENLTVFCAKLSMRSDFSLMRWVLTALYYAFGPWDRGFKPQSTNYAVRAACLWYVYAAEKMWDLIGDQDELWESYTLKNWKQWKQCLAESRARAADEDTGKLLEKALNRIEHIETSRRE